MKIDLIPVDKFILLNKLEEVSDSMLFEKGNIPTDNGLLSTRIFGSSVTNRKETFAFMDLNGHFLHPSIYKLLKRLNKNFEYVVNGAKRFIIKDGQIVEDEENGETGIEFLYKNWDKLDMKKNNSMMRNERIDVLKAYPRDTLFIKQWIIIPAFYRDVNLQDTDSGKVAPHELTVLYSKLLRLVSMIKDENGFDFTLNTTRGNIQDTLVEIYDNLKSKIEKKNGIIRKFLLGKSIDYGVRSVISAPTFNANNPDDMLVDFYHAGIPLHQCCVLFTPFMVHWLKNFFRREFESNANKYPIKDKDGSLRLVKLKNPESYFTEEYIKKALQRFVSSPSNRFDPIEVPIDESENVQGKKYMRFKGRYYDKDKPETESPLANRPATWTDILYMAAYEVTQDKHVYITRYPLTDYLGIFPNKISVLSTHDTVPMYVSGRVYPFYPDINLKLTKDEVSTSFIETVNISNLYLSAIGGDYDGDQVTVKAVFSMEANAETDKNMRSKSHIISALGTNSRTSTNEAVQTLYMLTRSKDE